MEYRLQGKLLKGIGGLYTVRFSREDADRLRADGVFLEENGLHADCLPVKARGAFRHDGQSLLIGDEVTVRIDTELARVSPAKGKENRNAHAGEEICAGVMVEEVLPRKNELIRPAMAGLDLLFLVVAAAKPAPVLETLDKLLTVAEYQHIEPIVLITKADLDRSSADYLKALYRKCGYSVFVTGLTPDSEEKELYAFLKTQAGKTAAFAGASGVGKSTLMNRLFPKLSLATGELSAHTERGRHTTRHIELYPLDFLTDCDLSGYLADTPGFSMIDFASFDFYTKDDLPYVFREFAPYLNRCRYTKCTHTKEEGCAILEAVKKGLIPEERHKSYLAFWEVLKNKHEWDRK